MRIVTTGGDRSMFEELWRDLGALVQVCACACMPGARAPVPAFVPAALPADKTCHELQETAFLPHS